jgi:hypothetical protein
MLSIRLDWGEYDEEEANSFGIWAMVAAAFAGGKVK